VIIPSRPLVENTTESRTLS